MNNKYLIPATLSLIYLLVQIAVHPSYGINWDAPYRFLRGQAYVHFFLTGQLSYNLPPRLSPMVINLYDRATRFDPLTVEVENQVKLPEKPLFLKEFNSLKEKAPGKISFYQAEQFSGDEIFSENTGHPPLPDILAAFFNKIFYQVLGWVGDIESFQLFYILSSSLAVFVATIFTIDILQLLRHKKLSRSVNETSIILASLIAAASISFYPLYFAESHFNMKDSFIAGIFAFCIWSFFRFILSGKVKWFYFFSLGFAVGLSVKWNVIFLPFILLPWLLSIRKSPEIRPLLKIKKLLLLFLTFYIINFTFLILIWPNAWSDPLGRIGDLIGFYQEVGLKEDRAQPPGFVLPFGINGFPAFLLFAFTPEIILLLLSMAIFAILSKKIILPNKIGVLLILWIMVPVIRISLPNTWFYSGVRQIMEVIPAIAILAGIGSYLLFSKLKALPLITLLSLITLITLLWPILNLHPNQNLFFNSLVGGVKGAYSKGLIEPKLTYGNPYKQAALWLNENAEKNANLALLDGNIFALSPLWLREDISLSPYHFSGFERKGEYIIEIYNPKNPASFAYRYPTRFLKPLKTIDVDGAAILTIYKNDGKSTKPGLTREEVITDFKSIDQQTQSGTFLALNLGKEVPVTRLIVINNYPDCQKISFKYSDERIDLGRNIYLFNEKKVLDGQIVEYLFPGDYTQFISIYPQNNKSCFANGEITEVWYVVR
jgi:hypothetical protein